MKTPYHQLDIHDKGLIKHFWNTGHAIPEISDILKVSLRSASRVLRELGINTKRKNRYNLDERYFSTIDTAEKAYLLGILASDGHVSATNYIALQMTDPDPILLFVKETGYTGDIHRIAEAVTPQGWSRSVTYRINFSSKQMATDLARYGLQGRKTETLDFVLAGSLQWAFILGYFDGDGGVYENSGRSGGVVNIVGTEAFVTSLSMELGYGRVYPHPTAEAWYWRITGRKGFERFYDLIYQQENLGLQRKKTAFSNLLGGYKSETRWATQG
tara:strand:- start:625 stop:1440 length:816 start_codon:yes stop_codon:yes gene_type:complete